MSTGHIVKSFTHELSHLSAMVQEMGALVDSQIERSVRALSNRDSDLAREVTEADGRVDAMEREIRTYAVRLLARRQPMARDLRFVIAAMSVATDLERLGDHIENVGDRAIEVNKAQPMERAAGVPDLGRLAQRMTRDVMDAFAAADAAKARAVRSVDSELDARYAEVFRDLLAYLVFEMDDPRDIAACTHLLFIGKNFEHAGNLTANIAESVLFCVEGDAPGGKHPG